MPDIRVIIVVAVAAVLVFILATQLARPGVQVIEVSLSEWEIDPQTIEARPGVIRFVATNEGAIEHEFEIEGEIAGEEREWEIEDIEPGETKALKVKLPPGEYEIYCPIPGHRENGMEGTLVVKEATGD